MEIAKYNVISEKLNDSLLIDYWNANFADKIQALVVQKKKIESEIKVQKKCLQLERENTLFEESLRDTASILNMEIAKYNVILEKLNDSLLTDYWNANFADKIQALVVQKKKIESEGKVKKKCLQLERENTLFEKSLRDTAAILNTQIAKYNIISQKLNCLSMSDSLVKVLV